MNINIADYRVQCFEEIEEILARVEVKLLDLRAEKLNLAIVHDLFRDIHTLKGSALVVGLNSIGEYAHELETVLDRLRMGELSFSVELLDLLFFALDSLRSLVGSERLQTQPIEDVQRTHEALRALARPPVPVLNRVETASAVVPVEAVPVEREFRIAFVPAGNLLSEGGEPLEYLAELAPLGTLKKSILFTRSLPPLEAMEAEQAYFFWFHSIVTTRSLRELRQVFATLTPANHVSIEPANLQETALSGRDAELAERLLQSGKVTAESISEAWQCQKQLLVPLEVLALRDGKIDAMQFKTISKEICDRGIPFASGALQFANLRAPEIEPLLERQTKLCPTLSECLVALNLVDPESIASMEAAVNSTPTPTPTETVSPAKETPPVPAPVVSNPLPVPVAAEVKPEEPLNSDPWPPTELMLENLPMMGDFITEIQDHLNTADQLLLTLEKDPTLREMLDALYRAFHTVKGAAGFFGLEDMKSLAHEAESLLNDARDGKITLTGRNADFAFGSLDGLNRQLEILRVWMTHQGDLPRDLRSLQLIVDLKAYRNGTLPVPVAPPTPKPSKLPIPPEPVATEGFEMFDPIEESNPIAPAPSPAKKSTEKAVRNDPPAAPSPAAAASAPVSAPAERETIRVDCEKLDKLINMIGELVISSSMVEQEVLAHREGTDLQGLSQLNKIVRDLQELSLGLRMVPIAGTFRKMERIVRDVARKLNKKVQFISEGEETELDKTVVDQIGDPLMHMVRNAVDHGIELPEVRNTQGKNETGTVKLRAFHQGGNIYIELSDDGKGLDRKAIYRKAVERGLIADGTQLSDAEICSFIFHPGFSTAKEVTDVSGRGVGMDVVRRNVEALQGSVTIRSEMGHGSTMAIRLPLTLAILDGLCVSLNHEVFVVPLLSVVESFQPGSKEVKKIAGRTEVILVRGEVVPLLRLYRIFMTSARCTDPTQGLVVIVEDQGKKCAVLVDELLGQSQVVIKNLEKNFIKVDGIAGATILGNGRVGLILDIYGLTRMAGRSMPEYTESSSTPASTDWQLQGAF
jgi:two-component system chemotaxis sensor kinase CheA